jgi:hypothetical protein
VAPDPASFQVSSASEHLEHLETGTECLSNLIYNDYEHLLDLMSHNDQCPLLAADTPSSNQHPAVLEIDWLGVALGESEDGGMTSHHDTSPHESHRSPVTADDLRAEELQAKQQQKWGSAGSIAAPSIMSSKGAMCCQQKESTTRLPGQESKDQEDLWDMYVQRAASSMDECHMPYYSESFSLHSHKTGAVPGINILPLI